MQHDESNGLSELMEQIISNGTEEIGAVFARLMNMAMRIERERFIGAGSYERTKSRRAYSNGSKPKRLDTSAGSIVVDIPKTRNHGEESFYPQALERGRRSTRAVMLAVAEMYVKGVSTRDVAAVMSELGVESLSSSQVSRAAKMLDGDLERWRTRPLDTFTYIMLDARYEKARIAGSVRDVAVLSVIGVEMSGARRVLGVSVALSEAEIHWREFLDSLVARGLRGVEYIVSDSHAGLLAARRAVFTGATWQRCQFHLSQNAIQHAPNTKTRKQIGPALREIWNAPNIARAQELLNQLVKQYQKKSPKFANWLEVNIPQGFAVFSLPAPHRRRMRTSNPIERSIQQELKRRTRKIRVFPSEESLLRLVTAVIVEIDDSWAEKNTKYIKWNQSVD